MIVQKIYSSTPIGAGGVLNSSALVSVGAGAPDKESAYQRFAAQVAELEVMEREGLLRIDERHRESGTGQRHVDLVRFTRLK